MFLLHFAGPPAEFSESPFAEVEDALRGRDDVEGGRDGPALLEVGDPKLAPGKLPLDVGLLL